MTDRNVVLMPKWYTTAQVAELLGFGLYKTKMLIATGELRSLKDGKYRRILPEWVDEYVRRRAEENAGWLAALAPTAKDRSSRHVLA